MAFCKNKNCLQNTSPLNGPIAWPFAKQGFLTEHFTSKRTHCMAFCKNKNSWLRRQATRQATMQATNQAGNQVGRQATMQAGNQVPSLQISFGIPNI